MSTPRITSTFWVHGFLRQAQTKGQFGAVLHKGADQAGAVYVVINRLNGQCDLLAPPPGPAFTENGDRRFQIVLSNKLWSDINRYIERQKNVDSDIWVVEIEDREGFAGLTPET